jgi:hypothetical protein
LRVPRRYAVASTSLTTWATRAACSLVRLEYTGI